MATKLGELELIRDATDDPLLYSHSKSSKDVSRLQGGIRVLRSYLVSRLDVKFARDYDAETLRSSG